MNEAYSRHVQETLAGIKSAGLWKEERPLFSPQGGEIDVGGGRKVLNFCANNYLGLAHHPAIAAAAHAALDQWGYGLASVRFICGTQELHERLEARISSFLKTEATILYSSCFDANGGVFETLLGADDAVISDELNHASIIDGIRLCKAKRFRYRNCDLADLETRLREADAAGARFKLVVSDGVFSMDGVIAPLQSICDVAEKYGALVMVDDSHAVGFMGEHGRGTPEHCGVLGRIDILTGTLGKALGGASGGYVSGRRAIVDLLRQRSRPYLFSNTLAPVIAGASLAVLDLVEQSADLRRTLWRNTARFRAELTVAGLPVRGGEHPIVPIMLGDAVLAQKFSARMLELGVYVVGFFYPVVPAGAARIRTQVSAAHTPNDLDRAISAFIQVKQELCPSN